MTWQSDAPPATRLVGDDCALWGGGEEPGHEGGTDYIGWVGLPGVGGPKAAPAETHLEPAQTDHAVHHLRDAEAVPEVVERVVPVIVVHAELRDTGLPVWALLPTPLSKLPGHLASCFGRSLPHPRPNPRPRTLVCCCRPGRGGYTVAPGGRGGEGLLQASPWARGLRRPQRASEEPGT